MRRPFPAKVMVDAFKRAKGHCQKCTARLYAGKIEYDHRIPDQMGGEPTLDNCQVLCSSCHGTKTHKHDQPAIAKAKRRERKLVMGIKKASIWPKKYRRKVSGETVLR